MRSLPILYVHVCQLVTFAAVLTPVNYCDIHIYELADYFHKLQCV